MATATAADVKAYLKIETTAQDAVIAQLLTRAFAEIEMLVGKALIVETIAWRDDVKSFRSYEPVTALQLRYTPVSITSIADVDGNVVAAGDYVVRQDLGQLVAIAGVAFPSGPYVINGTAGFSLSPTYATREEPFINQLIIDLVGFYLQQRTPGASAESAAGTRVDYGEIDADTGLPKRIMKGIRRLKGIVIG